MNKVPALLFLILLSLNLIAQDTTRQNLSRDDYLKKSKSQKTAGLALLAGSIGCFAIGAATFRFPFNINLFGSTPTTNDVDNTVSTAFGIAGFTALVSSIICFASSAHNKKMAYSLNFTNQPLLLPYSQKWPTQTQPTITLKFPLHQTSIHR